MARSYLRNAVDVELAAPVATPDTTITVDDAVPLPPVPFYLVVDPFSSTDGREYMLCTNVAGVVLTVDRNLDGTDSTTHPTGDIVRISYVSQILNDLWDGIEATSSLPVGGVQGESLRKLSAADGDADWQPNITFNAIAPVSPLIGDWWMDPSDNTTYAWDGAGWQNVALAYLPLLGGIMEGPINMASEALTGLPTPIDPPDAATKGYVDGLVSDGPFLPLSGGDMSGLLTLALDPTAGLDAATKQYVDDSDVGTEHTVSTVAPGTPNTGDVWVDPDSPPEAVYLPLAGGEMAGQIKMGQNILWDLPAPGNPDDAARKAYVDAPAVPVTDQPGGTVLAAAASGVIQRWNGDGDGVARRYEWRRSASFGTLELYAIQSSGVETLAISVDGDGFVTIPNLVP